MMTRGHKNLQASCV